MRSYLHPAHLSLIDCWEENNKPYDNVTRLKFPVVNAKECHLYLRGPRTKSERVEKQLQN